MMDPSLALLYVCIECLSVPVCTRILHRFLPYYTSKNSIINPYQGAQKEFLVLWKGWPIQDASWVAQKDLTPYLLKYGFRTSFYVVRESFL